MPNTSKLCVCGFPARFDSYQYRGHGYSGFICINNDCSMAWTLQDQTVVTLVA